jgi:hypothetical protein
MGQNTITYTIGCVNGIGTGVWSQEQTHVNQNGKLIIAADGSSGGVQVWQLPSDVVAPSNNFTVNANDSKTLNIKGSAPIGTYSFMFKALSCPGDNDPPEFIVDK